VSDKRLISAFFIVITHCQMSSSLGTLTFTLVSGTIRAMSLIIFLVALIIMMIDKPPFEFLLVTLIIIIVLDIFDCDFQLNK